MQTKGDTRRTTHANQRNGGTLPNGQQRFMVTCLPCLLVVFVSALTKIAFDDTYTILVPVRSQAIYIKFILGKSPHVRHSLAADGTLIKFYTFDEAFPVHVDYVIMCAKDRRPMCIGKTDAFKEFARKLDEVRS